MPRITNSTAQDIWIQAYGQMVPALSSIDTFAFLQGQALLPAGITIDNSLFTYNPIILSQKITGSTTVVLPATTTGYQINLFCTAGEVSVYFNNNSSNTLLIPIGGSFNIAVETRIINQLVFAISSGTVYLTVRKA